MPYSSASKERSSTPGSCIRQFQIRRLISTNMWIEGSTRLALAFQIFANFRCRMLIMLRTAQASVTFDAAYCFLLVTIDKIWELDAGDNRRTLVLGNLFAVMMGVLRPLAQFLVQQPLGQEGKNAAPCFGYYHFKKGRSALEMLQSEMQRTIDGYCAVDTEDADQVAITDFGSQLELLLPVQHAIASLIDLDTFERKDQAQIKKNMPGIQDRGVKGFAKGS